ncbi:MAG: energy transducer TonB [Pleurocapsa sp.]
MSYESKLDHQSSKLVNPAQLCLLLSIALHLLVLKFGLPTIKFNDDSGRREVSIIELNPEQQSRLPDLSPQLNNQASSNLDNLPRADSGDPAAPFAIPPNLIPGIGDSRNLPPLTIPPPPIFDFPAVPPMTNITLPPVGDLSNLPQPPTVDPSDFQVKPIKIPPNTGKIPAQPNEIPTFPQKSPQANQPPQAAVKPEQKPQLPVSQPEVKQPKPTPEQIAAQKTAQSQERISNLRQSLTKTNADTTDEDARKNYVAWLAKVEAIEPAQIEIQGTYPRDACIKRLAGSSVFGVVVNSQGAVAAIDLIKGAEYAVFNQQASQDISDRTFENQTNQPKPYQVKVNYQYDAEICPSLTLPSIRRAEEKQQKTEPKLPEPQPAINAKPESKPQPQPQSPQLEIKPESKPPRDRLQNSPLPEIPPSDL